MIATIVLAALLAQQPAPAAPQAPPTPRAAAQVDITGNWVALVTEEWRWRMMTPPKGDYPNVPMNAEARKIADAWDLNKDNTAGEQCKAFGAGAIMRLPLRLRVTWADDNTLKVETDAGQQTRLFNFDKAKQLELCRKIITDLGYDWNAGRLDLSEHPFSTSFNPKDSRITTRVNEKDLCPVLCRG